MEVEAAQATCAEQCEELRAFDREAQKRNSELGRTRDELSEEREALAEARDQVSKLMEAMGRSQGESKQAAVAAAAEVAEAAVLREGVLQAELSSEQAGRAELEVHRGPMPRSTCAS